MSACKNSASTRRQRSLLAVLALCGTLLAVLAAIRLICGMQGEPTGEQRIRTEKAMVRLLKQTFPSYQTHSEMTINGMNLQTIYSQSGVVGYSAILFNTGCSSCRKERLFVAALAKDRRITAVEILTPGSDPDERLEDFFGQFVGKGPSDDLVLGSEIRIGDEAISPAGASAIIDGISEFLRTIDQLGME